MSEPFLKANDRPLTLEAAKLHAVLVEVDRFVAEVRSLPDAIRGDLDRQEAAIAALHALLGEMKEHNAETGEQYSLLLQSARSVVHTIAEEALADSITKKIVSDIYAELTPQLKEEVNKESERNSAASAALAKELMSAATGAIRENAAVIADAVAGKPPLPPVPPEDYDFAAALCATAAAALGPESPTARCAIRAPSDAGTRRSCVSWCVRSAP